MGARSNLIRVVRSALIKSLGLALRLESTQLWIHQWKPEDVLQQHVNPLLAGMTRNLTMSSCAQVMKEPMSLHKMLQGRCFAQRRDTCFSRGPQEQEL